jgi:N-methylhydantoinase A
MAGFERAITFDMGGTSTDVSLCPGRIQETTEGMIAGLPLRLPIIDIHTVGAGGGSIARLDAGGALRVGPQSAGSDPGPVCYGRDEAREITVTDANLVLGRLDADHFLAGRMKLDLSRAQTRMQELARRLSLPLEAAAWGVIRVANSNMERAIRTISVERGHDPRDFTLVAFGGAGPLHACELASALRIPRVLIPPHPGVLSALGMVLADVVKDYSQTVMLPAAKATTEVLDRLFAPLYERARSDLRAEGFADAEIRLLPALDMRYVGQSFELEVRIGPEGTWDARQCVQDFHEVHRRRFSYASKAEPVEIVNVRLKATGMTAKPQFTFHASGDLDPRRAQVGYKFVYFADSESPQAARPIYAALYQRDRLTTGNMVVGPAVIFQFDTTSVLPPGWAAMVDGWGNLLAEMSQALGDRGEPT